MQQAETWQGKRFFFAGAVRRWPYRCLDWKDPQDAVQRGGGEVLEKLDEHADYVVIGEGPAKGRADAIRKADKLREKGHAVRTLREAEFLHFIRPRLDGLRVAFVGGFGNAMTATGGPGALVQRSGGIPQESIDDALDLVVIGEGRAAGKTALMREVEAQAARRPLQRLTEEQFLGLVAYQAPPTEADVPALVLHLRHKVDPGRVDRALAMLKKASYQLYTDQSDTRVAGIVRSQSDSDSYYASWLEDSGRYGCCDPGLIPCMGLQGRPCKHIMVLLLGLAVSKKLEPAQAISWVDTVGRKTPVEDEDGTADLLLRYKGATAGEIDWRPVETLPEDYYSL